MERLFSFLQVTLSRMGTGRKQSTESTKASAELAYRRKRAERLARHKRAQNLNRLKRSIASMYAEMAAEFSFRASEFWKKAVWIWRKSIRKGDKILVRTNREVVSLIGKSRQFEEKKRLELIEGLVPRLGNLSIEGNVVINSSRFSFKIAELKGEFPEDNFLLKHLYDAGCPLQRIDRGRIGSSDIKEYTRWVEERVKQSGLAPYGWLESLKEVADTIATSQLSWKSYLIYPEELMPEYLGRALAPLELKDLDLLGFVMGLFYPLSDFNPESLLRILSKVWQGKPLFDAATPQTLFRTNAGIESGGGVYHKTLRVVGLGAVERPDVGLTLLRNVPWLRNLLLSAIEEAGEEILIATTIWGVKESRHGSFQASERGKISRNITTKAQKRDILAREEALRKISQEQENLPFKQSIVVSLRGESQSQTKALYDRAVSRLLTEQVLVEEVHDAQEHWDNLLTFMPDVRRREVRHFTTPMPSTDAASIFRRKGKQALKTGALLGYFTHYREPLIFPLGGNYFFTGTTGSGKSMAAKYLAWRLIPLNPTWSFRFMDNTSVNIETVEKARGWKDLVEAFGGEVLFAGDPEFANPDNFRARLEKVQEEKTRILLFHSTKERRNLDEIYLEWLVKDIQVTGPGVVAVDETAHWFTQVDDIRAKLWVYDLLNQMRNSNKLSVTTIQSLGVIRSEQPGVWNQLMTLIDGGKFVFHTPHISALHQDLGISEVEYPEVSSYIRRTVASFKPDELGPLQKPGWAVFVGTETAEEVKIQIDPDTLLLLARKDTERGSEDELWGL